MTLVCWVEAAGVADVVWAAVVEVVQPTRLKSINIANPSIVSFVTRFLIIFSPSLFECCVHYHKQFSRKSQDVLHIFQRFSDAH
jgi:hypothetical protein